MNCLSYDAMQTLSQYDWPGNVRELENTLERVVLIHDKPIIESDDIKYILDENKSSVSVSHAEKAPILDSEIAEEIFSEYDVVVDGTDNFETRYISNSAAVITKKHLVSGALSQWEGQVSVFAPHKGGPCYACVFPSPPKDGLAVTCSEGGVFSPLPGVIGSVMAVETLKILSHSGNTLLGQMFIYDGLKGESRKIKINPNKKCPICSI